MILSDRSIKEAIAAGRLGIEPFDPSLVQPSSVDVRLDARFLVFRNTKRPFIDTKQPSDDLMELVEVGPDEPMYLHPAEFILGSTVERVRIPDDLVARLEGRSSLGRLGIVIHSSLPYSEPVLFRRGGYTRFLPIGEIVAGRLDGEVVAFDRDTFRVSYHRVTNWFEEPPDHIYEVRLASGRRVSVTAGHNLFTLDPAGNLSKIATADLRPGTRVAIPARLPPASTVAPSYHLLDLLAADTQAQLTCSGPTVQRALEERGPEVRALLHQGRKSPTFYRRVRRLPLPVLVALHGGRPSLSPDDRLQWRGGRWSLPAVIAVDQQLAWLLGLYVAEGHRRTKQVVISNTDQRILDRAEQVLGTLGQPTYRTRGALTGASTLVAALVEALEIGGMARRKKAPRGVYDWPVELVEAFFEGLLDGDGSRDPTRDSVWTTSAPLVHDLLALAPRMSRRAAAYHRSDRDQFQVAFPLREQKLLTSLPTPTLLLRDVRLSLEMNLAQAATIAGYRGPQAIANVEGPKKHAVHLATLRRLRHAYPVPNDTDTSPFSRLVRLTDGDLAWDRVTEVTDTGRTEPVYDLEVRPGGQAIENFLAGFGGIFVSNTAGYIDPGFEGHITLEISNLASLPIALYPGMRIGQISFIQMTTPAERAYGPERGSKYHGQQLPTASRLHLDFQPASASG